jgi:glutamate/tyrosine decarboxylase-like PLP-dependent enzyme
MTQLTKKQYKYNAEEIVKATKEAARKLRQIPGIQMLGDPKLCVIAFRCVKYSSLDLADYLNHEHSWGVSSLHKPEAIHVSLTLANYENVVN